MIHQIICKIFGHEWQEEKPRRRCLHCGQIQVKQPRARCSRPGRWVNHED